MITLFVFGPAFGLPDPSPFVTKAEILLKMSGLDYRKDTGGYKKAPKGKLPYIADDGAMIADSTFIRWHLEKKYRIDFDNGLNSQQRATSWAFEKMMEDHLYWAIVADRWTDDGNFNRGPKNFFKAAPAPLRPFIIKMIRNKVRRNLFGHGLGRHSAGERHRLAIASVAAIAGFLADKPYVMGAEPTAIDAATFAFTASAMCSLFESPIREAATGHDNLRRYISRMTARFYPELGEIAGCKAAA